MRAILRQVEIEGRNIFFSKTSFSTCFDVSFELMTQSDILLHLAVCGECISIHEGLLFALEKTDFGVEFKITGF